MKKSKFKLKRYNEKIGHLELVSFDSEEKVVVFNINNNDGKKIGVFHAPINNKLNLEMCNILTILSKDTPYLSKFQVIK